MSATCEAVISGVISRNSRDRCQIAQPCTSCPKVESIKARAEVNIVVNAALKPANEASVIADDTLL